MLKEDGKTAQSDKWMWGIRGRPPDQLSMPYEYDPACAGSVAVRLLDDFKDALQTDGYFGYNAVCKAIDYTLNQWQYLVGYCERDDLMISNAMAENAIRPFAIGRKSWLFADTRKGAEASAACYSLIETAKANNLEQQALYQAYS